MLKNPELDIFQVQMQFISAFLALSNQNPALPGVCSKLSVSRQPPCSRSLLMPPTFLGVNLIPMFSKKATHLLCPSGMGLKFEKAREWGIPVVTNEWLAAIAETGAIPSRDDYTIGGAPSVADVKGKGRAIDVG